MGARPRPRPEAEYPGRHRLAGTFLEKGGELGAFGQNGPLTIPVIGFSPGANGIVRHRADGKPMALHLERISWMPSPPLVPEDGPIDLAHLKRMTLDDAGLEREVLTMFVKQAARLAEALAGLPAETLQLAHTLSGSARAVGAFAVAEAAEGVHSAVRHGGEPAQAWSAVKSAVAEARLAIEALLRS